MTDELDKIMDDLNKNQEKSQAKQNNPCRKYIKKAHQALDSASQTYDKYSRWVTWPLAAAFISVASVSHGLYEANPESFKEFVKHKANDRLKDYLPSWYEEKTYTYPKVSLDQASLNSMVVPKYVDKRMKFAVESTGLEYDMLRVIGAQESSFKATVVNQFTKACGIMQLVPSTQLDLMYNYGEEYGYERLSKHIKRVGGKTSIKNPKLKQTILNICTDAFFSLEMGAEYARENIDKLHKDFPDRYVSYTDIYMYHFLGGNGGRKFIANLEDTPNRLAVEDYSSRVLKGNKATFYKEDGKPRSYAEIYKFYAEKLSTTIIAPDQQRFETHYSWDAFLGRANFNLG
tara:strand:+ start:4052 stop:5086 length:1035 start_codon:yes stop_codon:yes gene_type:complete